MVADITLQETYVLGALDLFERSTPANIFSLQEQDAMRADSNISHMEEMFVFLMVMNDGQPGHAAMRVHDLQTLEDSELLEERLKALERREPKWELDLVVSPYLSVESLEPLDTFLPKVDNQPALMLLLGLRALPKTVEGVAKRA